MVAGITHDPKANGNWDAYLGFVWVDNDWKIKVYDMPVSDDRREKLVVLLQKVIEDLENRHPLDMSPREVNKCKDCG